MKFKQKLIFPFALCAISLFLQNNAFASKQPGLDDSSPNIPPQHNLLFKSFMDKISSNDHESLAATIEILLNLQAGRKFLISFCQKPLAGASSLQYSTIQKLIESCYDINEQYRLQVILNNFDSKISGFLHQRSKLLLTYKRVNDQKNKMEIHRERLISQKSKLESSMSKKTDLLKDESDPEKIKKLSSRIQSLNSRINRLNNQIDKLNSKISALSIQLNNLQDEIEPLNLILDPLASEYNYNPIIFQF